MFCFIQKLRTQVKNVNFFDMLQMTSNINYNKLLILDYVSFYTNGVVYNLKLKNLGC
jgi:hypothetical protein